MELEPFVCSGLNHSNVSQLDYTMAETGKVVAGLLIFLFILPFVLFEFRVFPLGTTPAVLLGAVLMVASTVLSQEDAYRNLGEPGNVRTIALLFGMMLLAQYFEREGIIKRLITRMLKPNISFPSYLWRVCLATSVTSAFITNDAACVALTPLWLDNWSSQNRHQVELETLLLAISTSANIGSAATIFGNPQMALIASKTNVPHHEKSRLDLLACIIFLGLPTLLGSVLNVGFLILHWKIRRFCSKDKNKTVGLDGECIKMLTVKQSPVNNSINVNDKTQPLKTDGGSDFPKQLHDECTVRNETGTNRRGHPLEQKCRNTNMNCFTSFLDVSETGARLINQTNLQNVTQLSKSLSDLEVDIYQKKFIHFSKRPGDKIKLYYPVTSSRTSVTSERSAGSEGKTDKTDRRKVKQTTPFVSSGLALSEKLGISRSVQSISVPFEHVSKQLTSDIDSQHLEEIEFSASESKVFHVCLWMCLLLLLALLFVHTDNLHFDMGLLPVAAATVVMLADALWNRRNAIHVIKRVDWSVIVMFLGLFVWMAGLNATRIPRWIWYNMGLSGSNFDNVTSLTVLCVFITICSNVFSNVPLTIIVLEQLQPCAEQLPLVLYLAWCSTVAGNLTLFGSVANLIVAQKSKMCLQYQFSYWSYLKFGFVTTFIVVVVGIIIINIILRLV